MPFRLTNETNQGKQFVSQEFENTIELEEFTYEPQEVFSFPNQAEAQRFKRHYNLYQFEIEYFSEKGWTAPKNIRGPSKKDLEPFAF